MTITSNDPVAVWHFNSKKSNAYFKYSNSDFGCYPIWVFWNLRKALNILHTYKILQVNKLTFLGTEEVIVELKEVKDVDEIFDIIVKKIDTIKTSPSIRFSGQTILVEDGQEKSYFDIVEFHCGLSLGSFSITLFSDCWVPIDRNDKLQIDLAEKCSPILSKALKEIKGLEFDSVDPDSGEENTDELLPQFGFKVYLYDSAINEIGYNRLSKEDRQYIEKHLWKNRMLYPA